MDGSPAGPRGRLFIAVLVAFAVGLVAGLLLGDCFDAAGPGTPAAPDARVPGAGGPSDQGGPADAGAPEVSAGDPSQQPESGSLADDDVVEGCRRVGLTARDPNEPAACTNRRWVGVAQKGACPSPADRSGWRLVPVAGEAADREPVLDAVCVYEFGAQRRLVDGDLCELPSQSDRPPGDWLDRDCRVVAPVAGLSADLASIAQKRYEQHLVNIGTPEVLVAAATKNPQGLITPRPSSLVDILDSAAPGDSGTAPERWYHGLAMHGLARAVGCQGQPGGCVAEQRRRAALTGDVADLGGVGSGATGYQLDVARALLRSLRAWRELQESTPEAERPPGLVINLSVGWDARYTRAPRDSKAPRASAAAVFRALELAACQDVIVVAAAGNRASGPNAPQAPIYPAAWEEAPAPGPERCACLLDCGSAAACSECGTVDGDGWPEDEYHPLVHAVGGVDDEDLPLAMGRAKATPRLVAPALQVGVPVPDGAAFAISSADALRLPLVTGTSAAAATVSGVASLIWHMKPGLAPWEVMEAVYAGGVDLGRRADFCSGKPGCPDLPVRRVSLCGAMRLVDDVPDGAAPVDPTDPPTEPPAALFHALAEDCAERVRPAFEADPGAGWPDGALDALAGASGVTAATWAGSAPEGEATSPSELYPDAFLVPYAVNTQPGEEPCGACGLAMNLTMGAYYGDLVMAISSRIGSVLLYDTTLETWDTYGHRTVTPLQEQLKLEFLRGGETYHLTGIPLGAEEPRRAILSWAVRGSTPPTSSTGQVMLQGP